MQCARALVTSHDYQRAMDYYNKVRKGACHKRLCIHMRIATNERRLFLHAEL